MRRKVVLFVVCGLVLPLVAAGSAWGQGAQLLVDDKTPTPGQAITVTGAYSATAPSSDVQIRLNGRSGRLLATTPVTSGRISATFPVPPDLAPGWYLLVGVQTTNANGRQAAFSPGRARIRVGSGNAGAAAPPGGGGGFPDSPLGFLALASALLLLGTGATLTARRIRAHQHTQLGHGRGI